MDNNLIPYQPVISDIKNLITVGRNVAYNAANRAMIMTYWNIGKRIVEEEQSGAERAEYFPTTAVNLGDNIHFLFFCYWSCEVHPLRNASCNSILPRKNKVNY